MGYIRHHMIVVTSWQEDRIEEAQAFAAMQSAVFTTEVTPPCMNGYQSFMVAPDGSKEGWYDSVAGDRARSAITDKLADMYLHGADLEWVLVQFADDDGDDKIVDSYRAAKHGM